MTSLVERGLAGARDEYARREDEHALHDLQIEVAFWLAVEGCEMCDGAQLCSAHYERMVMCL